MIMIFLIIFVVIFTIRGPCREIILIIVDYQEAVHREEEDDHNIFDHIFVVISSSR